MVVDFQTQPKERVFLNSQSLEARERNIAEFKTYLAEKYDYISKFDMLKSEKEARQNFHLSLHDAIGVWTQLYGE